MVATTTKSIFDGARDVCNSTEEFEVAKGLIKECDDLAITFENAIRGATTMDEVLDALKRDDCETINSISLRMVQFASEVTEVDKELQISMSASLKRVIDVVEFQDQNLWLPFFARTAVKAWSDDENDLQKQLLAANFFTGMSEKVIQLDASICQKLKEGCEDGKAPEQLSLLEAKVRPWNHSLLVRSLVVKSMDRFLKAEEQVAGAGDSEGTEAMAVAASKILDEATNFSTTHQKDLWHDGAMGRDIDQAAMTKMLVEGQTRISTILSGEYATIMKRCLDKTAPRAEATHRFFEEDTSAFIHVDNHRAPVTVSNLEPLECEGVIVMATKLERHGDRIMVHALQHVQAARIAAAKSHLAPLPVLPPASEREATPQAFAAVGLKGSEKHLPLLSEFAKAAAELQAFVKENEKAINDNSEGLS